MHTDSPLTCRDCGQPFVFTVREQEYYASRGFDNPPGRCPDCRAARKAERGGEPHSSGNRRAREGSARRGRAAAKQLRCVPMWIFGGRGQLMRKYRDAHVGIGPSPGPDLPHAWQGHSAEGLLREAPQRHAYRNGLDGLNYAAN